jgi:hypothetical protein
MCQFLLKKGAWLADVDEGGRTALHWATLSQQVYRMCMCVCVCVCVCVTVYTFNIAYVHDSLVSQMMCTDLAMSSVLYMYNVHSCSIRLYINVRIILY